jgi:hypothetical protein
MLIDCHGASILSGKKKAIDVAWQPTIDLKVTNG